MNCSERTTTYGRKIIKGTQKNKSEYCKILYFSWMVCFVVGMLAGLILSVIISAMRSELVESTELIESNTTETSEPITETVSEVMVEPTVQSNFEPIIEPIVEPTPTPELKVISLGEYKLTAYCSCEKCCGKYALNRPIDENGKPIVYTANMSVAEQGVTVAADTDILPFGTVLLIDGNEYIVQDRGGAIKGNRIDVYFESHEDALQFGVQHKEIFLKEEGGVINE